MTTKDKKMIRNYLRHGEGSCSIRIRKDGTVERYGDPSSDYNRTLDFWQFMGWAEVYLDEIAHHSRMDA